MAGKVYVSQGKTRYPVQEINGMEVIRQDPGSVPYAIIGSYDPVKASLNISNGTLIEFDVPLVKARRLDWTSLQSKLNPEIVVGNCIVLRRVIEDGLLCGSDGLIGCNLYKTNVIASIEES